jgi:hypothetical protein
VWSGCRTSPPALPPVCLAQHPTCAVWLQGSHLWVTHTSHKPKSRPTPPATPKPLTCVDTPACALQHLHSHIKGGGCSTLQDALLHSTPLCLIITWGGDTHSHSTAQGQSEEVATVSWAPHHVGHTVCQDGLRLTCQPISQPFRLMHVLCSVHQSL